MLDEYHIDPNVFELSADSPNAQCRPCDKISHPGKTKQLMPQLSFHIRIAPRYDADPFEEKHWDADCVDAVLPN